MKYSAVIVSAFAARALAAALPEGAVVCTEYQSDYPDQDCYQPAECTEYQSEYPDQACYQEPECTEYQSEYPDQACYQEPECTEYQSEYPDQACYQESTDYANEDEYDTAYTDYTTVPKPKPCYGDADYTNEYSSYVTTYPYTGHEEEYKKTKCFDKFTYPDLIQGGGEYSVTYEPTTDYSDDVDWYVYGSDGKYGDDDYVYSGTGSHNSCKISIPDDCIPSDDRDNGRMYCTRICKKGSYTDCAWSDFYPIYPSKDYYSKNPTCVPDVKKCPQPPIPLVYSAAEPTTAPTTDYAPTTESAAPVADSPVMVTNGSSAIRASISVVVGIAAFITFAL